MKNILKKIAQKSGLYLASTDRFGIDVDLDLTRFSAAKPLATIFDVGANCGQTACRLADSFPQSTIYSFEPVPETFQGLQDAVKSIPKIKPFNIALGDTDGTIQMNLSPNSETSSIKNISSASGTVSVEIQTLDRFCDINQIDSVDLLKIDVEGFELPVLRGAEQRLRSGRIRFVYAECVSAPNDEMPHTSFFDLHTFLVDYGFCFVALYAESFHLHLGCSLGSALYAFCKDLPDSVPGRVKNIV